MAAPACNECWSDAGAPIDDQPGQPGGELSSVKCGGGDTFSSSDRRSLGAHVDVQPIPLFESTMTP